MATDLIFGPMLAWALNSDAIVPPGQDPMRWFGRFNYGVTQHVGPRYSLTYLHLNFPATLGRVTDAHGAYIYPGNGFQVQDTIAAGYSVSKVATIDAGWFSKSQSCCPASSISHLAYRGPYAEGDFVLGKSSPIGPQWLLSVTAIYVLHESVHDPSFADGQSSFMGNLAATYTQPIGASRTFGAFVEYLYGNDYFDDSPVVTPSNVIFAGLVKTAGPNLKFAAQYKSFQGFKSGVPFVTPNTVHFDTLTLSTTYAYHF